MEREPKSVYAVSSGDIFATEHYSYAMQNITGDQDDTGYNGLPVINPLRGKYNIMEWRKTMNSQAIILGDRLLAVENNDFTNPEAYLGAWSDEYGESEWGVVWNDNHAEFANTPFFETKYGNITNSEDDIFSRGREPAGQNNVQSGGITTNTSPGNCFLATKDGIRIIQ